MYSVEVDIANSKDPYEFKYIIILKKIQQYGNNEIHFFKI